ncbi:hypothetical protein AVV36_gp032 [Pectobacterium bacteriophage PM2]|uniref:Uncharacterized protein n=1 Tax=Pectobacterium bacteriophage PM2 TaxID=1429794 RepID=A0A0A0PZE4_9CAUD|nr:hypothetical protein AVV36_gp032 [Pectobacterium bacteriophage PM2]AHY24994.1 hypothetical protein PM2_032 [Pectobacterium bacteriophage PM2]
MLTYNEFIRLKEDMVAGDGGYDADNIASGTTSGAIVDLGPETIPSKKRKKEPEDKL